MALTMLTVTGGANGWTTANGAPGNGKVTLQPVQAAAGGGWIITVAPVVFTVTNGQIAGPNQIANNSSATTLQYLVYEAIVGATNPAAYVVTPTGTTLDLSAAPRGTVGSTTPTYILASTIGHAGGVASLDSGGNVPVGELGNALLPATVGTVGGPAGPLDALAQLPPSQLAVTAARAVAKGLIAMTEDLGMVPSQSGVTAGRLFVYPFVAGQTGVVNSVIAAYQTATAGNVNTNTFIGIYNAAGTALLGQTADLASFLTTTTGAKVQQPIGSPSLVAGVQYNAALLNNYTTTGPQWMGLRLFGTNSGPTARCLVSAGTMSSLPGTLPALSPSSTNSMQAIEFSP